MTSRPEPDLQAQLDSVFLLYQGDGSDLIPILQDVQNLVGYIPMPAVGAIAGFLRIPESTVYGVVTFYTQFYVTRQGRHKIKVCQGTACHVRGSTEIVKAVKDKLGIGPGETTDDLEFSVEGVACFGACALAPVMVVNGQVWGNMTPDRVGDILDELL